MAVLLFAFGLYLAIPRVGDRQQEENISEAVFKQLLQMSEPQEYVKYPMAKLASCRRTC